MDHEGVKVLVVTVDPPRAGDPIHTLRKRLRNFEPGVVFTRLPGQTVQASPAHIEMLERRLLTSANQLDVAVGIHGEPVLEVAANGEPIIERWAAAQLKERIRPLSEPPRLVTGERSSAASSSVADMLAGIAPFLGERRTSERYNNEVRHYVSACQEVLGKRLKQLHARHPGSRLQLVLTNTDRPFAAVEVTIKVEGARHVEAEEGAWVAFPKEPDPWGSQTVLTPPVPSFGDMVTPYSGAGLAVNLEGVRRSLPRVRQVREDVTILYSPIDLRPHARRVLEAITLTAADADQPVRVSWTSTGSNVNGVCQGRVTLASRPSSIDLSQLLA
ncbi:hypothetical protein [Kitasatospora kifunensis]|uniref:Uncharacterized protein n=1 Tax=Kitasatospora kifunensis TaxID=58351 RepID=A0A7W7VYV5_KITKI|nr:hypothetical protein [Kitasatospora kifunensis]MBB4928122.1 hypothetical protein [Kitasatospora kifunensis]